MSFLAALTEATGPSVAVEIAADHVSAASLEIRGGRPVVSAHAIEPLPPGALVPSLTSSNIVDRATVAGALGAALERVGRARRIGLVVPDVVAKVSLVRFEQVPTRAADLEQLVRWQVKKTAPFPVEDAQVALRPGRARRRWSGIHRVAGAPRYRRRIRDGVCRCRRARWHRGHRDLQRHQRGARGIGGAPADDWLLVNMAADSASLAILRGPHVIFFRSRAADTEGTLADLVHQTAMYYEDRLKGRGFRRVMLAGAGAGQTGEAGELRRSLEERLATSVHPVDPRAAAALTDRIEAAPALLDRLAPLVGPVASPPRGRRVIRTNLSTRPFYNERIVHLWLLAIALIVFARDRVQCFPHHQVFAKRYRARHGSLSRRSACRRSSRAGSPVARHGRSARD